MIAFVFVVARKRYAPPPAHNYECKQVISSSVAVDFELLTGQKKRTAAKPGQLPSELAVLFELESPQVSSDAQLVSADAAIDIPDEAAFEVLLKDLNDVDMVCLSGALASPDMDQRADGLDDFCADEVDGDDDPGTDIRDILKDAQSVTDTATAACEKAAVGGVESRGSGTEQSETSSSSSSSDSSDSGDDVGVHSSNRGGRATRSRAEVIELFAIDGLRDAVAALPTPPRTIAEKLAVIRDVLSKLPMASRQQLWGKDGGAYVRKQSLETALLKFYMPAILDNL